MAVSEGLGNKPQYYRCSGKTWHPFYSFIYVLIYSYLAELRKQTLNLSGKSPRQEPVSATLLYEVPYEVIYRRWRFSVSQTLSCWAESETTMDASLCNGGSSLPHAGQRV